VASEKAGRDATTIALISSARPQVGILCLLVTLALGNYL
jgi:hypothetical protein